MRLVPIAAADLHPLCDALDDHDFKLHDSYLDRFGKSHFASIVRGTWDPAAYSPLRERESQRSKDARDWYETVTDQPTKLGRRIARCLSAIGIPAAHEQDVKSPHSTVRADILCDRPNSGPKPKVIVEMKAFNAENTMPSKIKAAVRSTLKKHAQLGGYLERQ